MRAKIITLVLSLIGALCFATEIVLWIHAGQSTFLYSYLFSYFLLIITGALVGICGGYKIGLRNTFGKSLYAFGVANLAVAVSIMLFDLNALSIEPSIIQSALSSACYLFFVPAAAVGFCLMMQMYHVRLTRGLVFRSLFFITCATLLVTYYLGFPNIRPESALQDTVDLFYTLGDIILLSLILITLYISKGKLYRGLSIYMFGVALHTAGNFIFVYRIAHKLYTPFNDPSEIVYLLSAAATAVGIAVMYKTFEKRAQIAAAK